MNAWIRETQIKHDERKRDDIKKNNETERLNGAREMR